MMIRVQTARFRRGPWFLIALLLALASALVPALSPTGAATPGRMLGSAFDPTNDVKALRGREQSALIAAASFAAKSGAVSGPEPLLRPASVPEVVAASQAYPAFLPSFSQTEPSARPRTRSPAQPRAPPCRLPGRALR